MAATLTSTGISVGATTAGAIVGANETPYAATILDSFSPFQAGLTTGDLQQQEPGDFTGAGAFAVELWLKMNNVGGSLGGMFVSGPQVGFGAGAGQVQWSLSVDSSGTLSVSVLDESTFGHGGAIVGAMKSNVWTHIVFQTVGLGGADLYVNGVRQVNDTSWGNHSVYGSANAPLNTRTMQLLGPPASSNVQWFFDELALYNDYLPPARITAHYNAGVSRGFAVKKVGARLVDILDEVSSHAPRDFQVGVRNVIPRYMTGQAPLEEARRALEADDVDAALFVKADGTLKFLAADHRSSAPYNISQLTVGDAGGSEIPYEELGFDYSHSFLVNDWKVTRTASGPDTPATQTASDTASLGFAISENLSDVPVGNDADALTIANALLAKHKTLIFRVTSISFNLLDATVAAEVFRRELMDKITVKWTPPGGGARISQEVYIQKIDITGDNSGTPIRATWGVSPL